MLKRVISITYSALSLFVGVFGIVKWMNDRFNGQNLTTITNAVVVILCALAIISPIVVYIASEWKRVETLKSIKSSYIEDKAVLPSTLSYLVDTITDNSIINKGVSIGDIIETIEIDSVANSDIYKSKISRSFVHIKSKRTINEINIRCNHHIFADISDYCINAQYGFLKKDKNDEYYFIEPLETECTRISKSTMNIRIVFKYPIKKNTDFSVVINVSHKDGDILIKDSIETFPFDAERMFSSWQNLIFRIKINDADFAESRFLQVIAFKRPRLNRQASTDGIYINQIRPNVEEELSIRRKDKQFHKDSVFVLIMQKKTV